MSSSPLKFGSLFSGIGGFDLGFERAGMECLWQVENDPWATRILEKHWPEVPRYGDVRELSADTLAPVDVICGGFPCQPVSIAGKRKAQADERWLWPEFARLVGEVRPRFVVVENVPGLFTAGGTEVFTDLAALGFDAEWHCIPAAAFGAPHLRWRVFIVAHTSRSGGWGVGGMAGHLANEGGGTGTTGFEMVRPSNGDTRSDRAGTSSEDVADSQDAIGRARRDSWDISPIGSERDNKPGRGSEDVADTERERPQRLRTERGLGEGGREVEAGRRGAGGREKQPTADPDGGEIPGIRIRGGDVANPERDALGTGLRADQQTGVGGGRSGDEGGETRAWWATEPAVGRVAHGISRRVDRLRGLGNAVVPQITEMIGKYVVRLEEDLYG